MRSKPLCFGGSFNPIHVGHLRCAEAAATARGFAIVTLIPAAQPPHKPASHDLASPEHRLAMTKLAAEDVNRASAVRFEVDDLELHRAGPSFTFDTVAELKRRGASEVWWLIGADMLNYLPKWRRADELIEACNFLILARPNVPLQWNDLPPTYRARLESNVVPAPLIDVSSTEIRRRIRANESIESLTTPAVVEYLRENCLYR